MATGEVAEMFKSWMTGWRRVSLMTAPEILEALSFATIQKFSNHTS